MTPQELTQQFNQKVSNTISNIMSVEDFKAFLACKDLLEWDQKTDFYKIDNAK